MVAVAQLVEPLVVVQAVAGSSPVSHPKGEVNGLVRVGVAMDGRFMDYDQVIT